MQSMILRIKYRIVNIYIYRNFCCKQSLDTPGTTMQVSRWAFGVELSCVGQLAKSKTGQCKLDGRQAVCRGAASFTSCRAGGFLVLQCFVYRPWPAFVRSFVASQRSVTVGSLPAVLSDFSAFPCSCNGHMSYICPLCSCRLSCLCFRPRLSNSGFPVSYPAQ